MDFTYEEMYEEINKRIISYGPKIPKIGDAYELERMFMEEECSYVFRRKKVVVVIDRVSELLMHNSEPISSHFHELVDRLKQMSKKEKYFVQSVIGLDIIWDDDVLKHFDDIFIETENILPDLFICKNN